MLARFTTNIDVFRFWDLRLEASMTTLSAHEDDDSIVLDLAALRKMLLPLSNNSWQRAISMYGRTITPIYRNFQNMVNYDLERVAQVLSDLEPSCVTDECDEPAGDYNELTCPMNLRGTFVEPEPWMPVVPTKSRLSHLPFGAAPVVLKSLHPSIPTISITPPQEEHEGCCRVPLQNSAFRNQLIVPRHPAFNHIHPPMVLTSYTLPVLSHWRWQNGHWQGIVPSVEEQNKKGLFSRALVPRKRTWRNRLKS
ncbi:hypothetical protein BDZ94DRAFT_1243128 [Collybia nuda]|uniref:Uncharacterized protein n=1 Tax=Collybia nuda TaxID=64659 RepID=A0A9P6CKA0_9AGAR|nr:hypothetical protein BDZ94DRAFT_1243128 [Collybia nuda]